MCSYEVMKVEMFVTDHVHFIFRRKYGSYLKTRFSNTQNKKFDKHIHKFYKNIYETFRKWHVLPCRTQIGHGILEMLKEDQINTWKRVEKSLRFKNIFKIH